MTWADLASASLPDETLIGGVADTRIELAWAEATWHAVGMP